MFESTKQTTALLRPKVWALTLLLATLTPAVAFAEGEALSQEHGNLLWTLIAAILVMFMQPGFALVEMGFSRAKNAGNILMKNLLDFSAGVPVFFLVGFGIMFGQDVAGLFGSSGFALSGVDPTTAGGQWDLTFLFFQSVFAATAATIISGGIAERTKFSAYIIVSVAVTALIYPISGHWAWGSLWGGDELGAGWLEAMGFIDFAGSTVVHSVGGWMALAGAIVVGPRLGKYSADGKAKAIPGHNIPLAGLGVFILWFGWFGFNAGSTTTVDGTIGYIAVNTAMAACTGALGAMIFAWIKHGKPDTSMSLNGALAGLVAITAGCYEVSPVGALIIGLLAGILVIISIEFIDQVLKIDDPVGASSVHGVCGVFGTIAVGFFAAPGYGDNAGLFYGGGTEIIVTQIIGAAAVSAWALGAGLALFTIIKLTIGVRVSQEEELKGLDITEHGMESYNGFQIFTNE
ncbi:MAG: ammonium transporter [Desulfomicrobium sp.]|nr:ammonium transporter [Pseudomonadota bacterium]MBV1712783.1 ammonium transporter [Desulfomicrobium sp.]MBU4571753.1 ammonium transporter [Pseudomonadota bacterium]MBU4595902.1 ammonium transporter [Pseudomonadota bacterium]MBV1721206.1 ammonium transporter [Desulfomicrobium sp.]